MGSHVGAGPQFKTVCPRKEKERGQIMEWIYKILIVFFYEISIAIGYIARLTLKMIMVAVKKGYKQRNLVHWHKRKWKIPIVTRKNAPDEKRRVKVNNWKYRTEAMGRENIKR